VTDPNERDEAERRGADPGKLQAWVFGLLVLGCIAAFFVIQRLKHTPTPVQSFKRTPTFHPTATPAASCRRPLAHREVLASPHLEYVSFRLGHTERATVSILSTSGEVVARLVSSLPLRAYRRVSLCWNGHIGPLQSGGTAPLGEYRVEVTLSPSGREIVAPLGFVLAGE
jgi:hypothetical protein